MLQAVIFDMDGVMIDNQLYHKKAWSQLFKENGMIVSEEDLIKKIRGRPTIVGLREFFSGRLSETDMERLAKREEEIYKKIFEKDFKSLPGLIKFVKDIHDHKLKIGLATSSTKDLLGFTMKNLKIKDLFDVIFTSDQVSHSKPHPEIYLKTAELLGIPPENCIVFEDSIAGVESAKSAGMKVILVMTSHKRDDFKELDGAINDFNEISVSDLLTKL